MNKDEVKEQKLTDGALMKLLDGQYHANDELYFQVLELRCIHEDMIFRVRLSDGVFSTSFVFMDGKNFDSLHITEKSVIQLNDYEIREISKDKETRNVIYLAEIKVISYPKLVIGDPEDVDNDLGVVVSENDTKPVVKLEVTPSLNSQTINSSQKLNTTANVKTVKNVKCPLPGQLVKTTDIGETVKDWSGWVLKVRVVNKLPEKSIYGGKGRMLCIDLADESGVIRATAFDSHCNTFSAFQVNKVYWVSGGMPRISKEPKAGFHKHELKLENDITKVCKCASDTDDIPVLEFNFTPLSAIKDIPAKLISLDVIGVCSRSLPIYEDSRGVKRKKIMLVAPENGMFEVDIYVWGKYAEDFDDTDHPVVVIKNCKRSQFAHTASYLFMDTTSVFMVNPPDIPAVPELKKWYTEQCKSKNFMPELIPSVLEVQTESFVEARKRVLASKVNVIHVKCEATIIDTDPQYLVNLHCSACRNQVYDMNKEKLVCVKCGYVDGAIMRNLMTKVRVGDKNSSEWVTVLDTECRKLLSISSSFIESHNTQVWKSLKNLVGQRFHVHLKYDRSREARAGCQIVSMEAIPESIYF